MKTWTYSETASSLFCGERRAAVVTSTNGQPLSPGERDKLLDALNRPDLVKEVDAVAFDLEVCATSDTLNVAQVCADWAKRLRRVLKK